MQIIKDIHRKAKTRLVEALSRQLLRSRHFRRTVLRSLFKDHVSPNALAYVSFADHALIVDPRDHMIAFRLLSGQTWQRDEVDRAIAISSRRGALKPGGWFIDIGANIGTQSIYALLSGKFKGAVAIEPDPHNISLLRRNLEINGLSQRVHIVEAAASSSSGTAILKCDVENFGAHSIASIAQQRPGATRAVRAQTVDEILAQLGIAAADVGLAMIDVEGHEIEVLKGMAALRGCGVPIVAEVTATQHGQQGIAELRALLAPDYVFVSRLRPDDKGKEPEERQLATLDFGLRQTDVLIYKAR
jgi:FkbM family methyltransferase